MTAVLAAALTVAVVPPAAAAGPAHPVPAASRTLTATPTPTIAGTLKVGNTLTARPGTWAPAPVTLTFQWKRNGAAIAGATKATYKLVAADAGRTITVTVTGKRSGYKSVAKTSAARTVATLALAKTPAPTISGTAKVGQTLTAKPGTWAPAPVTLTYQWKRNGVAITGATKPTYKLVAADAGRTLTVTVTGKRSGYTSVAKSSAAKTVAAAPKPGGTGNPGNTKNCSDFATWRAAQDWFNKYFEDYGDVARLDADHDGIACETLPGAPRR